MNFVLYKSLVSYKNAIEQDKDKHNKDIVVVQDSRLLMVCGVPSNYTNILSSPNQAQWASKENLPEFGTESENSKIGDLAFTTDGKLYIQKGEEGWQLLVDLRGVKGEQGETGENGKNPEFKIEEGLLKYRLEGQGYESWVSLGKVKGERGEQGEKGRDANAITIQGTVNTSENLPESSLSGSAFVDDEGNMYLWVGTGGDTKDGKYKNIGRISEPKVWIDERVLREVYVNGVKQQFSDGILRIDAIVDAIDNLDESSNVVTSRAIKAEIDRVDKKTYRSEVVPTDEGSNVSLYDEGRLVTSFKVAGGGGGNGQIGLTRATLTAEVAKSRIKLGETTDVSYTYTHYSDGERDGIPANIIATIRVGSQIIKEIDLGSVASGETRSLSLREYLKTPATYNISFLAKYLENEQPKTRTAVTQVSVIELAIELYNKNEIQTYISSGGYKDGDTATVIISVKGGARTLEMYIDGDNNPQEVKSIVGSNGRQTFTLPLRTFANGSHSVQFVAKLDDILSNSIYMDVLKSGSTDNFVGLLFSRPDGKIFKENETPEILAQQYISQPWEYIAVKNGGGVSTLTLHYPNGSRSFTPQRNFQQTSERFLTKGSLQYRYEYEGVTKNFNILVESTTVEGIGVKEGATLELLAHGRSNTETNPAQWVHGSTQTTFEGVDFGASGWTGEALKLINGSKVIIGYKPFTTDAKSNGLTIITEIKTSNVRRNDMAVISCYDKVAHDGGSFGGFVFNPREVKIPLGGTVEFRSEEGDVIQRDLEVAMPFASDKFYHIALVIHPESEQKNVRLYINGVLSRADVYQDTIFSHNNPKDITIDSTASDIEVKNIRVYGTALTDDDVLKNYITERSTVDEMERLRVANDVLDNQTNDVSWDKLYAKNVGVLNISMEGGLEKVSGKSTDTKTRYDVKEVIFRSPFGRAFDLKATDVKIRRQGTSTSTYPHKNLRIELAKSELSKVYRNIGDENADNWELVEDKTYKMSPTSKPMKIINIKVDYADSSMMNNVGGAKLWNKLCREIPSLKNPGMEVDNLARSAIDGISCCMFTSDEPTGSKRFFGTAMFNNDKSKSGYLFGQTKKDGTEIALEGINNTNAVANYKFEDNIEEQLARKDATGFDASFEFLYPEKDYLWETAPENMKQSITRIAKFIKACTPRGVDPKKMNTKQVKEKFKSSKFKTEVSQYFSVESLCAWYVWTDYMMAVDQRAKNTFIRCWDGLKWWFTYYDGDTSWGKRNDAMLAYIYNITRDTWDAQRSKWAFEGHDSILWCLVISNLEEELRRIAVEMRTVMTNEVVREHFNEPFKVFSQAVHNKSNIHKYIKPTYTDYNGNGTMNYIFALDGTMEALKDDIIDRRFSLLDAEYNPEDAVRRDNIPCYIGKDNTPTTIVVHAGDEYYFGWGTQNGITRQYERVEVGGSLTLNFPDAISQNDPVRIAGASRLIKIDLASTAPYLQGAMNLNGCRILEEIVAPIRTGRGTPWFPMLGSISLLKKIDLTGQSGVTGTESSQSLTFDISSHSGIQELKLKGTSVKSVKIAEGSPISLLELPSATDKLRLRSLPNLTEEGLILEDWGSVRNLEFARCPQLDWQKILDKCTNVQRIRVEGVDIKDDGTLLERLMTVKGFDASGLGVETCSLIGKCQLTKYIDDEIFVKYQAHFPELAIRQPQYTVVEYDEKVVQFANMSNLDNKTGYKFSNKYEPSAHIKKIMKGIYRALGKKTKRNELTLIKLHDQNSLRYDNGSDNYLTAKEVVTSGEQGEFWTYFPPYYYKGINDILGNKKYAVISTDPNPDLPQGKKITGEELRKLETPRSQTNISGNNLRECIVPMNESRDYFDNCFPIVAKVNCKGWKYVNTTISDSFLGIGIIFFDKSDSKIKSYGITPESEFFTSGTNTVFQIPDDAEYFITCYPNVCAPEAYVWLTNSSEPADWEPDWVYAKEWAFHTLPCVNKNGKLMSVFDQDSTIVHHNNVFSQDIAMLSDGGENFRAISYEKIKDFMNLWFLSEGTRNPYNDKEVISLQHRGIVYKDMLAIGMNKVEQESSNHAKAIVDRNGIREKVDWSLNVLGVGNFHNSIFYFLSSAIPWVKYSTTNELSFVKYGNGRSWISSLWLEDAQRSVFHNYNNHWMNARYVSFGKYMDITGTSKKAGGGHSYAGGQGNIIEFKSDGQYNSVLRFGSGDYSSNKKIAFIVEGNKNSRPTYRINYHGVRGMFDGTIKKTSDIDAFEKMNNIG